MIFTERACKKSIDIISRIGIMVEGAAGVRDTEEGMSVWPAPLGNKKER